MVCILAMIEAEIWVANQGPLHNFVRRVLIKNAAKNPSPKNFVRSNSGISDLLDCQCLTNLTAPRLRIFSHGPYSDHPITNPDRYVDRCTVVVENIVQNMQLLEDVEMWGGLDLDEVHLLTELPKLFIKG